MRRTLLFLAACGSAPAKPAPATPPAVATPAPAAAPAAPATLPCETVIRASLARLLPERVARDEQIQAMVGAQIESCIAEHWAAEPLACWEKATDLHGIPPCTLEKLSKEDGAKLTHRVSQAVLKFYPSHDRE